MEWVYSDKVKEHFLHPKNILNDEDNFIEDGRGEIGNAICGDMMLMLIKVDKAKNVITDCKWKTYGCASAIASTSVLSEIIIGMTLEEAYKIKPINIIKELDGLPNHKIHCSVLGDKALRNAIDDYYIRNNIKVKDSEKEDKIICTCLNVTKDDIKIAVFENGVNTFEELQEYTKISTSCGECEEEARSLLEEFLLVKEEEEQEKSTLRN
jgi:Fe-S cluster assembly protein NifU